MTPPNLIETRPPDGPRSVGTVNGQPAAALTLPGAGRIVVAEHGGHLLSWQTIDGVERLYMSPRAVFDGAAPIRGGVPVCFPQFSLRGPLPRHGFARQRPWSVDAAARTSLLLRQSDDDETRGIWPHAYVATLEITPQPGALRLQFSVHNPGPEAFEFTMALHTYLRVDAIERVRVLGLAGCRYDDSADGGRSKRQAETALVIDGEVDRIYVDAPSRLRLEQPSGAVTIDQGGGFNDTVVWNPGAARVATIADMPPDGHREMLCIEAARIHTPARVGPGERWTGCQRIIAGPGLGQEQ